MSNDALPPNASAPPVPDGNPGTPPPQNIPPARTSIMRWLSGIFQTFVFALLAFEVVNSAIIPAYVSTLDYLKVRAQADNADVTERTKADELAAKAKQERAAAENAAIIAKAQMEKAIADADAAEALAITKRQKAINASLQAPQEAQSLAGQAEIVHQKALQMRQTALNATVQQKALADKAVADAANTMATTLDCTATFSMFRNCPGDPFQRIEAKLAKRC